MWEIYVKEDTMSKISFDFTRKEYEYLCREAMLTKLQEELLEDKIRGLTITEMSMKRGASPEKVKRNLKKMTNKILKVI